MRLQNFKSWKDSEDLKLAPLTLFFGSNSSGKTSLLQSLLLLRQTVESTDRNRVLETGGNTSLVDVGTYSDIVHNHDVDQPVTFDLQWDSAETVEIVDSLARARKVSSMQLSSKHLGFRTTLNLSSDPYVESLSYRLGESEFNLVPRENIKKNQRGYDLQSHNYSFARTSMRPWPLPSPTKFYGFPEQVKLYFQNAEFLTDLELQLENELLRMKYLGPMRVDPKRQYIFSGGSPADVGSRGERTVDALVSAQHDGLKRHRGFYLRNGQPRRRPSIPVEQLVAEWLKDMGLIHSFSVSQLDETLYRVRVQKHSTSPEVLITDVGFGVSQVLPILTLLAYAEEGDILILEQPEIHLHPAVQSKLGDILIETAVARKVQLLVESHSEHLLERLLLRIAEKDNVLKGLTVENNDVAVYFCDQIHGSSRAAALEIDIFGEVTNWPPDFFGPPMGDSIKKLEAQAERMRNHS